MRSSVIEESDAALARQLYQEDELVAGMRSSVTALARQIEESDAALAHQLGQDELVADRVNVFQMETDAALARQLHHADLVAAGEI